MVLVHFRMEDGQTVIQKSPFPDEKARLLPEKTKLQPDPPARPTSVLVYFDAGGRTLARRVHYPPQEVHLPLSGQPLHIGYVIGLVIFALTVVAYTTYGGFWAVTLTDVLEGLVMLIGVMIMAVLAVRAVPSITVDRLPAASRTEAAAKVEPVQVELHGLAAATERLRQQDPALVYGPGP